MKVHWTTTALFLGLLLASPLLAEDTSSALNTGPTLEPAAAEALSACASPTYDSLQVWTAKPADPSATCTAQAYCEETGTYISCSGTSTCTAVDQDCANGIRGWVECGWDEDQCPACPIDCSGYPPRSKCIDGLSCKNGCNNCGSGTCWHGTCNCLI